MTLMVFCGTFHSGTDDLLTIQPPSVAPHQDLDEYTLPVTHNVVQKSQSFPSARGLCVSQYKSC